MKVPQLVVQNGQRYVEVSGLAISCPPWSSWLATILIAIGATYPQGGFRIAFYLDTSVNQGGSIPNQQTIATIAGRAWALISWHYAQGHEWSASRDDLASHIAHCRGFFLRRGAR